MSFEKHDIRKIAVYSSIVLIVLSVLIGFLVHQLDLQKDYEQRYADSQLQIEAIKQEKANIEQQNQGLLASLESLQNQNSDLLLKNAELLASHEEMMLLQTDYQKTQEHVMNLKLDEVEASNLVIATQVLNNQVIEPKHFISMADTFFINPDERFETNKKGDEIPGLVYLVHSLHTASKALNLGVYGYDPDLWKFTHYENDLQVKNTLSTPIQFNCTYMNDTLSVKVHILKDTVDTEVADTDTAQDG